MIKLSNRLGTLIIVLCCIFTNAFADLIKTEVDGHRLVEGESFRVFFTAEGQQDHSDPDFKRLAVDFTVIGVSRNVEMSVINGKVDAKTEWVVTVMPKRAGELVIPAIQFGNSLSSSMRLTIYPATQVKTAEGDTLLLASLSASKAWVQSEVNYRVQLLYTRNLANGQLTDPVSPDVLINKLGQDKRYKTTYQGREFYVLERDYAIFPQKSGMITISPPVFTGIEYLNNSTSNNVLVSPSRPIERKAKTLSLEVEAIPAAAESEKYWLPAKKVELQESWSNESSEIKLGEPLTRTIIIRAEGLTAAQLPDLPEGKLDKVHVYPDKPVVLNSYLGDYVMGQRKEKWAYIPTEAGGFTTPALKLVWWNIQTNQLETLTLPEKTFTVAPGENAANIQKQIQEAESAGSTTIAPSASTTHDTNSTFNWFWPLVVIVMLLGWIATLAYFVLFRRPTPKMNLTGSVKVETKIKADPLSIKRIRMELDYACHHHDAVKAKDLLIKWAKCQWPLENFTTLVSVSAKIKDSDCRQAIIALDEALYSNVSTTWQGDALAAAFKNIDAPLSSAPRVSASKLPPL